MTHQEFIEAIAGFVQRFAPDYGIKVCSPVIAQAILESNWGDSILAVRYHNYFGLKCGTRWTGPSVNLNTKEEYQPGTLTSISANFRVFGSMEEGVRGYFEFLQLPRYQNLRGIADPETYLRTIKADGYATSSTYVKNNMALIRQYGLTKYDAASGSREEKTMARTAESYLNVLRGWIGYSESNGRFRTIIDIYNNHKPLARGYKVKYSDEWCDTTVSAAAIKAGITDLIGTECGCEEHVKIFKQKGIWIEDGRITPKPGYIILYNWGKASQPNDGYSDHIGAVESVSGKTITVIEGNKGQAVSRRQIPVGWGYIRGYASPRYETAAKPATPTATITIEQAARNVLAGKYGNGDARKKTIESLGLSYSAVQARVNAILKGASKSVDQVAREVLAGQWGNGASRRQKLTAAGYDYNAVQKRVNELSRR